MLISLKSWRFWVLFAVFIVFPHYMAEYMPKYAATWNTMPIIILIFITIYFVVVGKYTPKEDYIVFADLKQIVVRFQNGQTIVLESGSKRIKLDIVEGKYLLIQDDKEGGQSETIRELPQSGKRVSLDAGEFFVTSEATGYIISWEDSDWNISYVLEAK